jgi:hypothetical protein
LLALIAAYPDGTHLRVVFTPKSMQLFVVERS